jgi:hypothetical protein
MNEIKNLEPILGLILNFAAVIGLGILTYRTFHAPDEKAERDIAVLQQRKNDFQALCDLRHSNLDKDIGSFAKSLALIQENDLKHIELEMGKLRENQAKIFTILDERLPKKQ